MKIYFAGSISAGRHDADLYADIIEHLKSHWTVLTEHLGSSSLGASGESLTDKVIHDRDIAWVFDAHVLVAEVTTPSLGVWYEIGRAVEQGKHILCLYRPIEWKRMSAMIAWSSGTATHKYETLDDAKNIIDEYFLTL